VLFERHDVFLKRVTKIIKTTNKKILNPPARVTLYPLLGLMVGMVIRLVSMTLRVTCLTMDRPDIQLERKGKNFIYAFWHGRQFALFYILRKSRCVVLTSLSEAGEVQKWVLRSFGHSSVRGSSTRGAASGLVSMIREVRKGMNSAFALDGPRGPVFQAKRGAIQVASKTGAYIVPVTIAFRRSAEFKNLWDLYRFPCPFTRAVLVFGTPRSYQRKMSEEQLQAETESLQNELIRLTGEADSYVSRGYGQD